MSAERPALPNIYRTSDEPFLLQGDIIVNPELKLSELEDSTDVSGLAVLNASCDLVQGKVDTIILSPVRLLERLAQEWRDRGDKSEQVRSSVERLMRNNAANSFFLPPTERFGGNQPHYIDLQVLLSFPFDEDFAKEAIQHRVASLLSPSRERLGQTLGQFFARVGLPSDQEVSEGQSRTWASTLSNPPA